LGLRRAVDGELAALDAAGIVPFDVHAHTGTDIDGTSRSCEEHVAALERVGGRSVVFPLCVSGDYAAENRRVIDECRRHPECLLPFARLDPRVDGAAEAVAALEAGARGFKFHPRAEDFRLDHPGVEAIVAVAAGAGVPVLVHAGAGVGAFGPTVAELADRHRDCPLILAHAGVSDLVWLGEVAAEHPNLFFDTSWWNPSDLLALFALVPPGRILFGSDEPYMDFELVLAVGLRCARFAGLSEEALRLVFSAQSERLLAGEPPLDAGPPPAVRRAPAEPLDARLATLLAAAGGCILGGGDPTQILELARVAVPDGEAADALTGLIEEAAAGSPQAPWAVAMALAVTLTPGVECPAPVA
jgi:predicted TIM-barrel fold metal-dependent hydrolase